MLEVYPSRWYLSLGVLVLLDLLVTVPAHTPVVRRGGGRVAGVVSFGGPARTPLAPPLTEGPVNEKLAYHPPVLGVVASDGAAGPLGLDRLVGLEGR